ncbi:MAG: hypothetical protein H0V82_02545 [Candidatus Protochlamydia sp.]|nr:hypothetical protein [Candidatus Protochlamydia sp.]
MNVYEKRVENQVQFWTLIGPFLILLSIAVLLYKLSSHWYFPLSTLIGIPLCVKWKMKGMAAALACLLTLSVVGYQSLNPDEGFWHVGMSLALAFSFIILTLSLEEVEGLIGKLQLESQSRLDNCLRLDEKLKTAESEWDIEKERLMNQVVAIGLELAHTQDEKQTFYKLVHLSKDELIQLRSQHDDLLQNLFYKKQQLLQLNEKLEETELTVQSFVNTDSEQTILKLEENLCHLKQEKEQLNGLLENALEEMKKNQMSKDAISQECEELKNEKNLNLEKQLLLQNEQNQSVAVLQELEAKLACIEKERSQLQANQTYLLQQCEEGKNLQNQFIETIGQQEQKMLELHLFLETKDVQIEKFSKNNLELFQQVLALENQTVQIEQELQLTTQAKLELERALQEKMDLCVQKDNELVNCLLERDNANLKISEIQKANEASHAAIELIEQNKAALEAEALIMEAELHQLQEALKLSEMNQERIDALEKELAKCRIERDNAAQKVSEVQAANEANCTGLQLSEQKKEVLEAEALIMRAELLKWQEAFKASEVELMNCKLEREHIAQLNTEFQAANEANRTGLQLSEQNKEALEAEALVLRAELLKWQEAFKASEVELMNCKLERDTAAQLITEIEAAKEAGRYELEMIWHKKEALEAESQALRAELLKWQEAVKISEIALMNCTLERDNATRKVTEIQGANVAGRSELELIWHKKEALEAEAQAMRAELINCQEALQAAERIQKRVDALDQELTSCKLERDNATQRVTEIQAAHEASRAAVELLEQKKAVLEADVQIMKAELLKWQETIARERADALNSAQREYEKEIDHLKGLIATRPQGLHESRKSEALYQQLKEQFQLKSKVLDSTRRELFASEEERLALLKEQSESELYGLSEREQLLQRELIAQGKEWEKTLKTYENEIDEMSALIQKLLAKGSN